MSELSDLPVEVDRDLFLRMLVGELAGALEIFIGLPEAAGFLRSSGNTTGREFNERYKAALGVSRLSPEQVPLVMLDLARRIDSDFRIVEQRPERIVLASGSCRLNGAARGRTAPCMVAAGVLETIAAENLGPCKAELTRTIAQGAAECRLTFRLKAHLA